MVEDSGTGTQSLTTPALLFVPTTNQRLRFVSVGSDCSVDSVDESHRRVEHSEVLG